MMVSEFKVPEYKGLASLTPEQLEENKKRLEEMNDRFLKYELECRWWRSRNI